MKTWD